MSKKTLDDDLKNRMNTALKEYKENFVADHRDAKLKESSVQPLDKQERKEVAQAQPDKEQREVAANA